MLLYKGQQIVDSDVSTGKTVPHLGTLPVNVLPVNVRGCSASCCQLKLPDDPWGSLKGTETQEVYDAFLHRLEL